MPLRLFVLCLIAILATVACGSGDAARRVRPGDAGPDAAMDAPGPPTPDAVSGMDAGGEPEAGTVTAMLSVGTTGSGSGVVRSEPAGIECGEICEAVFEPGTLVTLSAEADAGSVFTGWQGHCEGEEPTCVVTVPESGRVAVSAHFELVDPSLEITLTGDGTGRVVADQGALDCPDVCAADYPAGTTVTLAAVPDESSDFVGWSGGCAGSNQECTVALAEATRVEATFALKQHTLSLFTSGPGSGAVALVEPEGTPCVETCTLPHGTTVTLVATADVGSTFLGWNDQACSGTDPSCTFVIDSDQSAEATFALGEYGLVVSRSGSGTGSISSQPAGIGCGAVCAFAYDFGTEVTLSAQPANSSTFVGWTGCDTATGAACTVTIDGARQVEAEFELKRYNLDVAAAGTGSGVVVSDDQAIDCGAECGATYDHGSTVVLTARPSTSSTFGGWTNCPDATGATCTVSMTAARTVTATFRLKTYALTVSKTGNGAGTVTSAPAGITCGSDCAQTYNHGTSVTLTAAEASSSTFGGWTDCPSASGNTCTVSMTAARTVTATFRLKTYALTVNKTGNGAGTVTSAPAGITCGSDCAQTYNHGTSVTLTAAEASSSTFGGWTNCPSASGNTCTVSMTAARTVTATFTLNTYVLSVTKTGAGTGLVTSSPAGISCGSDCSQSYNHGTSVTLTASPDARMAFRGWTNCPSVAGSTCNMTLTAARTVNARFEVNAPPTVTITSPPNRSSFTQNGFDSATGLWFYTLTLTGQAVDLEDGSLSGSSLVWTTDRTDLQPANLGQGGSITVRLYTGCSSSTHQIRLTATDSNGGTGSAVITVVIGNLC